MHLHICDIGQCSHRQDHKATEAQLAATENELHELKFRHRQLEAMLEKAHQTSQDQPSPSSSETEVLSLKQPYTAFVNHISIWLTKAFSKVQACVFHRHRFNDIDTSPLLSISVHGRRSSLTSDEVRTMSTEQFSALWTVS